MQTDKKKNYHIIKEIFVFLMERKRWWLIPIIILLILIAVLIIFVKLSSVSPFIYALA